MEELTCLATWKEGSAYYLVGKMVQRKLHALPYSDGDSYRCFVSLDGAQETLASARSVLVN